MRPFYIKRLLLWAMGLAMLASGNVSAASLGIAPLNYETTLGKGELKKGSVDVINSSKEPVTVLLEVQAFRQTDDNGGLEFYPSQLVSSGIKLDMDKLDLQPGEGMKVYFMLDGAKLPKGDVFGAVMASSVPKEAAAAQSVRVGTLLMITNETPSEHKAALTRFDAPWLQIGSELEADMTVKNTADATQTTGFFPQITVAARPYSSKKIKGPLLFAARSRNVLYRQPGNYLGPIYMQADVAGAQTGRWIVAITGYWRWLLPSLLVLGVMAVVVGRRLTAGGSHQRRSMRRR